MVLLSASSWSRSSLLLLSASSWSTNSLLDSLVLALVEISVYSSWPRLTNDSSNVNACVCSSGEDGSACSCCPPDCASVCVCEGDASTKTCVSAWPCEPCGGIDRVGGGIA